jgi:putative oxidoreductase
VFSGNGGGWEFPAYLVVLSLVQALIGNGAWALGAPGRASAPA